MKHTDIKSMFAKYVSLNIAGMIGLSCYILADTFFVARGIGANGLTALNLAIPIYSFIHGVGLMIGMGGATRFALSKSKEAFTQAVYYALIAGGVFLAAGLFFSAPLAGMLGADGDTLRDTAVYLRLILCFALAFLANNILLCFVRNDGGPKLAMIAMLAGSFSNIILDYVFIFPCRMGMFGAALATGIAPVVGLLCLSVHFIKKRNTVCFVRQRMKGRVLADITGLGVSSLVAEFSSGIVMIVFNAIILRLEGNTGVAAYGIIANIALVVLAVFTGISQGMQPLISLYHSMDHKAAVKKVLRYGFATAILLSVAVYAVSAPLAGTIVDAFNKDGDAHLAQIATNGLRLYFTAFVFAGVNILTATYFSASDHPKHAFILSLLRGFVVILPVTLALAALLGINGVWLATTCTELLVLLVSLRMLRRGGTSGSAC